MARVVVLSALAGLLVADIARRRDRPFFVWWIVGTVAWPAVTIVAAALERRETRGVHVRSDKPLPDAGLAGRSIIMPRR